MIIVRLLIGMALVCCNISLARAQPSQLDYQGIVERLAEAELEDVRGIAAEFRTVSVQAVTEAGQLSVHKKVSSIISDRLAELGDVDGAIEQWEWAQELPIVQQRENAIADAGAWIVNLDHLLWAYWEHGRRDEILPRLRGTEGASDTYAFRAQNLSMRLKWETFMGDPDGMSDRLESQLVQLIADLPADASAGEIAIAQNSLANADPTVPSEVLDRLQRMLLAAAERAVADGRDASMNFVNVVNTRRGLARRQARSGALPEDIAANLEGVDQLLQKTLAAIEAGPDDEEREYWAKTVPSIYEQFLEDIEALKRRVQPSALIGEKAPEMPKQTIDGRDFDLNDLRGRVVVLDFWSVWCGPCISAFPKLVELHNEFGERGLIIVGVTRNYGYTWDEDGQQPVMAEEPDVAKERDAIARFVDKHKLPYPQLIAERDQFTAYGVEALPTLVLIDGEGIIRGYYQGNSPEILAEITEFLNQRK